MLDLLAILVGAFVVLFMCGTWQRLMRGPDGAKSGREAGDAASPGLALNAWEIAACVTILAFAATLAWCWGAWQR
jgi:hypothetical protein